jgi:hypothetical protein
MRVHSFARVTLAAAVALAAACQSQPIQKPVRGGPVDTGPATLAAARRYLEGVWRMESFEFHPPGKAPVILKGRGQLTYDAFGNMRIEVEADQSSVDILKASGIELRGNQIAEDGRTVVDMQARTLAYVLDGQPPGLGPLALNRLRHWQVDGNLLTLTVKDDAGKPVSISKWRKQ